MVFFLDFPVNPPEKGENLKNHKKNKKLFPPGNGEKNKKLLIFPLEVWENLKKKQ
jgi:hypothetical protein